jgi:5-oxoprolinase (ATP-hydrolysing)
MGSKKYRFAIDRGGTFTDVYCVCPGGKVRTLKLLSVDPSNYDDAPTEGIRRILCEVSSVDYNHKSNPTPFFAFCFFR